MEILRQIVADAEPSLVSEQDGKDYKKCVAEALAHEKARRWGAAAVAWQAATMVAKEAERAARARARFNRLPRLVDVDTDAPEESAPVEPIERTPSQKMADYHARFGIIEEARAKQNGLEVGATIYHTRRGEVLAECYYAGVQDWVFGGEHYSSITKAAIAASTALGNSAKVVNGWRFWGIEKQEKEK